MIPGLITLEGELSYRNDKTKEKHRTATDPRKGETRHRGDVGIHVFTAAFVLWASLSEALSKILFPVSFCHVVYRLEKPEAKGNKLIAHTLNLENDEEASLPSSFLKKKSVCFK